MLQRVGHADRQRDGTRSVWRSGGGSRVESHAHASINHESSKTQPPLISGCFFQVNSRVFDSSTTSSRFPLHALALSGGHAPPSSRACHHLTSPSQSVPPMKRSLLLSSQWTLPSMAAFLAAPTAVRLLVACFFLP